MDALPEEANPNTDQQNREVKAHKRAEHTGNTAQVKATNTCKTMRHNQEVGGDIDNKSNKKARPRLVGAGK